MVFNRKLFTGHLRLVLLLLIMSIVVSACDFTTSSPDSEPEETVNLDTPPVVRIETPLNGDTYQEGVGINILARVENAGSDVSSIRILVDGAIVGEQVSPNTSDAASFTVNTGWPAMGVGQHEISVSAVRGNGLTSPPAIVTINVVASSSAQQDTSQQDTTQQDTTQQDTSQQDTTQQEPTAVVPTVQVVATFPPAPPATIIPTNTVPAPTATTAPPTATSTPDIPKVTVSTGANVRNGAGTVFEVVGSLAAGSVANILAVNPAGTWYKIQYYNGEAWISAQIVQTSGDISTVPRDAGPPTPIPATATPVPTATPDTQVDLVITNVIISPHPLVCAQAAEIKVTVVNIGSSNSAETEVVVRDIYNGQVSTSTNAPVPALGPNQEHVAVLYLTVSTNIAEGHTTRVIVDPNNSVPETNEGNNTFNEDYVLKAGSC